MEILIRQAMWIIALSMVIGVIRSIQNRNGMKRTQRRVRMEEDRVLESRERRTDMDRRDRQLELMQDFMQEQGWTVSTRNDGGAFHAHFRTTERVLPLMIEMHDSGEMTLLRIPICFVAEDMRGKMCEAIARANQQLSVGGFQMDLSDGEVQFHAVFPNLSEEITVEQFQFMLEAACGAAGTFDRAFLRLLHGDDMSPAEVIAEVEMATMSETPPPDMESLG
ncbi:MAG: YbjN domain-containing protein [Phycisphaerae bacterium]